MDPRLVYAKTAAGDEAVRQSTRVVQRNLRMVLLQVDGHLNVEQLAAKIGNQRLVEGALKELEEGGFVEPASGSAHSGHSRTPPQAEEEIPDVSQFSKFSVFGPQHSSLPGGELPSSNFSAFDRSLMPFPPSRMADDEAPPTPAETRRARPKQGISVGRWLALGLAAALALALALLLFYPYGNFRPGLEADLSRRLSAPVRIGAVGLRLWPRPRLLLDDVAIGGKGEGRIASLAIAAPYHLLGSARQLPEVEVNGAVFTANRLIDLPMFGAGGAAASGFSLRRLRVNGATLAFGDLLSPRLTGDILLLPDGGVEKASVQSEDGAFRLEAAPGAQGVIFSMDSVRWKPADMPFGFASLQVSGVLRKDRLVLQKVDTEVLGGVLKGSGWLDWSAGMAMAGEGSLARIDSAQLASALAPSLKLEGELGGAVRLRASGADWRDMLERVEAGLDAQVTRGTLAGVDLGELARQGAGAEVRSGSTRFDTLRARLDIAGGRVVVRAIGFDAGLMLASGRAIVEADGRIDGLLTVEARSSVATARVPAHLGGTLRGMILKAIQ